MDNVREFGNTANATTSANLGCISCQLQSAPGAAITDVANAPASSTGDTHPCAQQAAPAWLPSLFRAGLTYSLQQTVARSCCTMLLCAVVLLLTCSEPFLCRTGHQVEQAA